jgi:hypothetical protein
MTRIVGITPSRIRYLYWLGMVAVGSVARRLRTDGIDVYPESGHLQKQMDETWFNAGEIVRTTFLTLIIG